MLKRNSFRIVNYTKHRVVYIPKDKSGEPEWDARIIFPSSGKETRIITKEVVYPWLDGIETVFLKKGEAVNLPEPEEGKVFIVSKMVFDKIRRKDLIAPDTRASAVRDNSGKILGITKFYTHVDVAEVA